jgi:hypothetical protein
VIKNILTKGGDLKGGTKEATTKLLDLYATISAKKKYVLALTYLII